MTVKELIIRLQEYPPDAMVYVPSIEFACDTVLAVNPLQHENLPPGISVSDDVVLLPWTREEYERLLAQYDDGDSR